MNVVVGPRRNRRKENIERTRKSYIVGYLISVYLTVTAYFLVHDQVSTRIILFVVIITLALLQFAVQMLFFLHLGRETRTRWKLLAFSLMLMIVCILVFGTLWIMYNLNTRMMPSTQQMEQYMQNESGDL